MTSQIFQPSDLASKRTEFLAAARSGRATLRDKDGTSFVMIPSSTLDVLEGYARWSQTLARLSALAQSGRPVSLAEWGEFAWLRAFDAEDLKEFLDELHDALALGLADYNLEAVTETVEAWRVTARQMEDPLRRSVLLSGFSSADYEEVEEPESDTE